MNPDTVAHKLIEAGSDWADKESAASLLEETRKTLRSTLSVAFIKDGASAASASMQAEASDAYNKHIRLMVEARKQANLAKVRYNTRKTWTDLARTQESTKRAEMQLR